MQDGDALDLDADVVLRAVALELVLLNLLEKPRQGHCLPDTSRKFRSTLELQAPLAPDHGALELGVRRTLAHQVHAVVRAQPGLQARGRRRHRVQLVAHRGEDRVCRDMRLND